jgi:hypothetical protein
VPQPFWVLPVAGFYPGTFTFQCLFKGVPAAETMGVNTCVPPFQTCTQWNILGGGTALFDVVPEPPSLPNMFYIAKVTYTFETPEPSTTALFLAGLAVLAFQVRAQAKGRLALRNTRFTAA